MIVLKPFQQTSVDGIVEIFGFAKRSYDEIAAVANGVVPSGCTVLLEAPTGSGKSAMAASAAETFSREERVVWFWFAPFGGLVEQTKRVLAATFPGLRVRDIAADRVVEGTRSGDIFVLTWASAVADRAGSRRIRKDGESSVSLDNFVEGLRHNGFRVGHIPDEAHHGFLKAKGAVKLVTDVLRPDYSLLVTATPNDADVAAYRKATGVREVFTVSVSRGEAVAAGLIKPGVRSIAYLPDSVDARRLVDFRLEALRDGVETHGRIKAELERLGIPLVPLMLVQVDSTPASIDEARQALIRLGIAEDAIASYTADEPTDALETIAADETKEVLLFKIAAALGFDAPRAFTLVSMRSSRDPDFGTQLVGRLLRVHSLLQARRDQITDLLRYGYVFLSDEESQRGVKTAAERINAIVSNIARVAPNHSFVFRRPGGQEVTVRNGGAAEATQAGAAAPAWIPASSDSGPTTDGLEAPWVPELPRLSVVTPAGKHAYRLRADVPRRFLTEQLPFDTDGLAARVVQEVDLGSAVLMGGIRQSADVKRIESDLFGHDESTSHIRAELSESEIRRRAQTTLSSIESLDFRALYAGLLERVAREYASRGQSEVAADQTKLSWALARILATGGRTWLLAGARKALARMVELEEAGPLPETLEADESMESSTRNVYGVMPQFDSTWERRFAEDLDRDGSGVVAWWHRNPVHRADRVAVVLADGHSYYPDFIVGVRVDGEIRIVLVEIKGEINRPDSIDKVEAKHAKYGQVVMLHLDEAADQWRTVAFNRTKERNYLDRAFDLSLLPAFAQTRTRAA